MPGTTWNPNDQYYNYMYLSGGDLVAYTTSSNYAWIRTVASKTTGKYYWEIKMTTFAGAQSGPAAVRRLRAPGGRASPLRSDGHRV